MGERALVSTAPLTANGEMLLARRTSELLAPMPVDPALVPKRKLYTGALIPAIGLGTLG